MFYDLFGIIGVCLSAARYFTYTRAILKGTTRPHAFSWLGATLMAGIAAYLQWQNDAGPGLWVTVLVTFGCLLISILALFKGDKDWTRSDWASAVAMLLLIPVWLLSENELVALVLVLVIEMLNYYPTVRKSWRKPYEEDLFSWFLSALRWLCAALAVSNMTLINLLYPAFVSGVEFLGIFYLVWRRTKFPAINCPATIASDTGSPVS